MKSRSGSFRFILGTVLSFILAGMAAALLHHHLLGRLPASLASPWIAASVGLVISFVVAVPAMLLIGRSGRSPAGLEVQKAGAETQRDAIL